MIFRDRSSVYFECREQARINKKLEDKREFHTFVSERSFSNYQPATSPTNSSPLSSFPNIFSNKSNNNKSNSVFSSFGSFSNNSNNSNGNNTGKSVSAFTPSSSQQQQTQPQQPISKEKLTNLPHCFTCGVKFGIFTSKVSCDLCTINFCTPCLRKISSKDITGVLREGQVKSYCSKCVFIVTREESTRKFTFHCEKASKDPLFLLYNEITLIKKAITGSLPNFEYLAQSIIDIKNANSKNRETFLQVYNEVITLQNDLAVLFKDFDKTMKLITSAVVASPKQDKIKSNMKSTYVSFLQQNLPKFKTIQNEILHLEMNTCTNSYIILCGISIDNQLNREFWSKYGAAFQNTISILRADLFSATVKCGENWDKHKSFIDEMIIGESKSVLNIKGAPNEENEGTLIRKNIEVLTRMLDQINMRVKPEELKNSKLSIFQLLENLTNVYKKGLRF